MSNVRTVSDTKRAFYTAFTRPINALYRRIVEELMVEMHLLSVNVDFSYDPIYALGVVTTYDKFMESYRPEADRDAIFQSLCRAVEGDPDAYRQDAQAIREIASQLSIKDLEQILGQQGESAESGDPSESGQKLTDQVKAITGSDKFKYSRLFAIGLYSLLEASDPEVIKDVEQLKALQEKICTGLKISSDKVTKDLELYTSNLDKATQLKLVIEEAMEADRKKREKQEQEKLEKAAQAEAEETSETEQSQDSSESASSAS